MRKMFKARCRLAVPVPVQHLTEEQEKVRAPAAVKHKGEWCALVPHDHEFTDPYLFDEHLGAVHGRKPIKGYGEGSEARSLRRVWKAPRLTGDGVPFEPAGLDVGATVTWEQTVPTGETYHDHELGRERDVREQRHRPGQVWSQGPLPKSVWVVPFEPYTGVDGEERAVLLVQDRDGSLWVRQTFLSSPSRTHRYQDAS